MDNHDEARRYGKYVAFLIDTYKLDGMAGVLMFLDEMDEFETKMLLAYLIQSHGEQ